MRVKFIIWAALCLVSLAFVVYKFENKKTSVWLIGDSTMAAYPETRYPLTGWGMSFATFFDSTVIIENKARGGRSTRTFLSEGLWGKVEENIQPGDYVMMQFGHNDEARKEKYKDRYTPVTDYITNLEKFISDTRNREGIPIVLTPVSRMKFEKGKAMETHLEYTAAAKMVALRHTVLCIDLDSLSRNLYQQMGEQNTMFLFMQLLPGENPGYAEGLKDNTHFNDFGARKIAELIWQQLLIAKISWAKHTLVPWRPTPSRLGLTNVPDTSFTTYSAYTNSVRKYPEISIATVPQTSKVKEEYGLTFCTTGSKSLAMDIFSPAGGVLPNHSAVMIIFGGGWRSGSRTQHHALARALASKGYTCFTPDYRLSTEALFPAAVLDVKSALQYIRLHAADRHIDSNKIAVMGFSAGGELAAFMGTTGNMTEYKNTLCYNPVSDRPDAVIDLDGTLSFVHPETGEGDDSKKTSAATYWLGFSRNDNTDLWKRASPLTYVGKNTPPFLFLNSSVDRMHAGRNDFTAILAKNNIYYHVKTFSDAPHAFPLFEPWFTQTVREADIFLNTVFK